MAGLTRSTSGLSSSGGGGDKIRRSEEGGNAASSKKSSGGVFGLVSSMNSVLDPFATGGHSKAASSSGGASDHHRAKPSGEKKHTSSSSSSSHHSSSHRSSSRSDRHHRSGGDDKSQHHRSSRPRRGSNSTNAAGSPSAAAVAATVPAASPEPASQHPDSESSEDDFTAASADDRSGRSERSEKSGTSERRGSTGGKGSGIRADRDAIRTDDSLTVDSSPPIAHARRGSTSTTSSPPRDSIGSSNSSSVITNGGTQPPARKTLSRSNSRMRDRGENTAVQMIEPAGASGSEKQKRPAELMRMDSVFIDDIGVSKKWLESELDNIKEHDANIDTKETEAAQNVQPDDHFKFWIEVEQYRAVTEPEQRQKQAKRLSTVYLAKDSIRRSLDPEDIKQLEQSLRQQNSSSSQNLFDCVQSKALDQLRKLPFPDFLRAIFCTFALVNGESSSADASSSASSLNAAPGTSPPTAGELKGTTTSPNSSGGTIKGKGSFIKRLNNNDTLSPPPISKNTTPQMPIELYQEFLREYGTILNIDATASTSFPGIGAGSSGSTLWHLHEEKNGLTIHTKKYDNSPIACVRSACTIDAPPFLVFETLMSLGDLRKVWDDQFTTGSVTLQHSEHIHSISLLLSLGGGKTKVREIFALRSSIVLDGAYVCIFRSIPSPIARPNRSSGPSTTVGEFLVSGWIVRPGLELGSSHVVMVNQFDYKGQIPQSVIQSLNLHIPVGLMKIKKHYKKLDKKWEKLVTGPKRLFAPLVVRAIMDHRPPSGYAPEVLCMREGELITVVSTGDQLKLSGLNGGGSSPSASGATSAAAITASGSGSSGVSSGLIARDWVGFIGQRRGTFCVYAVEVLPHKPTSTDYAPLLKVLVESDMTNVKALCNVVSVDRRELVIKLLIALFEEQGNTISFLRSAITDEIQKNPIAGTLLRGQDVASHLISCYAKLIGDQYLADCLVPLINTIVKMDNEGLSFETNPRKLAPGDNLDHNRENITACVKLFLHTLHNSAEKCPMPLRRICQFILREVNTRMPQYAYSVVGAFMFLRFMCPAIVSPIENGLLPAGVTSLTAGARRGLIMATKLIQQLSNGDVFADKEEHMVAFNQFVADNLKNVKKFIDIISNVPYEETKITRAVESIQVPPAVIEEIGAPLHFLCVVSLDPLHAQIGHVEVVHSLTEGPYQPFHRLLNALLILAPPDPDLVEELLSGKFTPKRSQNLMSLMGFNPKKKAAATSLRPSMLDLKAHNLERQQKEKEREKEKAVATEHSLKARPKSVFALNPNVTRNLEAMLQNSKERDARIEHLQTQRDHVREAIVKLFLQNTLRDPASGPQSLGGVPAVSSSGSGNLNVIATQGPHGTQGTFIQVGSEVIDVSQLHPSDPLVEKARAARTTSSNSGQTYIALGPTAVDSPNTINVSQLHPSDPLIEKLRAARPKLSPHSSSPSTSAQMSSPSQKNSSSRHDESPMRTRQAGSVAAARAAAGSPVRRSLPPAQLSNSSVLSDILLQMLDDYEGHVRELTRLRIQKQTELEEELATVTAAPVAVSNPGSGASSSSSSPGPAASIVNTNFSNTATSSDDAKAMAAKYGTWRERTASTSGSPGTAQRMLASQRPSLSGLTGSSPITNADPQPSSTTASSSSSATNNSSATTTTTATEKKDEKEKSKSAVDRKTTGSNSKV